VCFIACNRVRTWLQINGLLMDAQPEVRPIVLKKQLKIFSSILKGVKSLMIMPANYSVIAENELTYVEGGAFNFYVAPITDGGKVLAKNIVEWIGNAYTASVMNAFIGTWFNDDGSQSIVANLADQIGGLFTRNTAAQKTTAGKVLMGLTNAIGVASGLYLLGASDDTVAINPLTSGVSLTVANPKAL
jgi:hypothetical protein